VWRALRDELHPKGLELVTVGLDTLGAEGCRAFIEAAAPTHPSLVDRHHVLADRFGITNIPMSVWIDESFTIVRLAESAPAPPGERARNAPPVDPQALPERMRAMMAEAARIPSDAEVYHAALRDWVERGAASRYALSPDEVVARSRPRDARVATGHAHFALATHLETLGNHARAVHHFREAHRLVPESWTFRRQAWSLEQVEAAGPFARFWQGPHPDHPEDWPYEGDWLTDVRETGPEHYTDRFEP
jgi:hypothetical protein